MAIEDEVVKAVTALHHDPFPSSLMPPCLHKINGRVSWNWLPPDVVQAVTALTLESFPPPFRFPTEKMCILPLGFLVSCRSVQTSIHVPAANSTTTLANNATHESERHDGKLFICAYVHISSVARDDPLLRVQHAGLDLNTYI